MATFTDVKNNIKDNLNDASIHWSSTDLDNAVQYAYTEIVALSQCIIKKVTKNFQNNLTYYNFQDSTNFASIYVADYMATTAIFSNLTNLWLLDDKALKDFDKDRLDWENWTGSAVWWAPTNDYRRIAIIPKLLVATNSFDLYYWAQAPVVVNGDTPLVPPDFVSLIEIHATAQLLEIALEYTKAKEYYDEYWGVDAGVQNYDQGIYKLIERSKNLAKSDLLLLG